MDATTGSTQCFTSFDQLLKLNGKLSHEFPLPNVTAQFKQFLHKYPQTRPQTFTLVTGIDKAVEGKVDFPSFRAAVSAYISAGILGIYSKSSTSSWNTVQLPVKRGRARSPKIQSYY